MLFHTLIGQGTYRRILRYESEIIGCLAHFYISDANTLNKLAKK